MTFFTCVYDCFSAICLSLQRHWPGLVWEAADWEQSDSTVSSLQKHAASWGCSHHSAELSYWRPCGFITPRCGLCAVSACCCSESQDQVRDCWCTDLSTLFFQPLVLKLLQWLWDEQNGYWFDKLCVFHRYRKIDFLYLNAGIMPNPQVDIRAFFKGLFSR